MRDEYGDKNERSQIFGLKDLRFSSSESVVKGG